jgi:hypothetical protein
MPGSGATVLKKLLIGFLVFVAVFAAVVLVVPSFVDWTKARGWVAVQLGALAGRPVTIAGEVGFSMLPTPRLVAGEVSMAGESGEALLTAERLELRVLLLPLLLGRVEVERLALVDPVLRIERRPEQDRPATDGEAPAPSPALFLERVGIENGTVLVDDRLLDRAWRLDAVHAEVAAESLAGPFQAEGRIRAGPLPVAFDLRTGALTAGGALPVTLTVAARDGADRGRFAGLVFSGARWQGDLAVQSEEPRALLGALRGGDGESLPAAPGRGFSLRGSVDADGGALAIDGLTAGFGESQARGALALTLGRPLLADLSLAINRIDVDAWPGGGPDPARLAAALLPPADAAFALPDWLEVEADLAVEAIRYNGGLVRQLRLQAALGDGAFTVGRLSAQLPGGSDFGLIGRLESADGRPSVDLRAEAGSNDLRGLLSWLDLDLPEVPGGQLRRFAGALALSGTPDAFRATGVDLTVDNTRLTGGLAFVDRGVPGIGLRFDIDRANLDAYRAADGEADWLADALERVRRDWPALLTAFNANVDGRVGRLTLGGIAMADLRLDATLSGGSLTLREASVGDLAGLSARVSGTAPRLADPPAVDLTGSARIPAPTRLAGLFGLDLPAGLDRLAPADLEGRLRLGETENLSLTASLPDGGLELSGGTADAGGAGEPEYRATVRLRHASLAALVDTGLLGSGPADPSGGVDLYARLSGRPEAFRVETLQGMAGPLTLAADARIVLTGPRPRIEGSLRTGAVPLDALLPAAWRRRPDGRWPAAPLDLSGLRAVDGSLALTARSLTLGPYAVADPAATLSLADGVLEVERLTGGLFGGDFGLSGRLADGDLPAAAVSFDLVGADAGRFLGAAVDADGLAGTIDVGFDGESRGLGLAGLAGNAAGEGLVAVRDGSLSGLDLGAAAAALEEPGSPLDFLQRVRGALAAGRTGFAALNAPFAMADGVAESESLRLVGDLGVGTGQARYDPLGDRFSAEIDFSFHGHPEAPPIRLLWEGRPGSPVFRYRIDALREHLRDRLSPAPPPP